MGVGRVSPKTTVRRMVHEGGWKLARSDDDRLLTIPPAYDYYAARAPDTVPAA